MNGVRSQGQIKASVKQDGFNRSAIPDAGATVRALPVRYSNS